MRAFSFLSTHIKEFLVSKGVIDEKQDLRVKDVRGYLMKVLKKETLDPPIKFKKTLVHLWDSHYYPILKKKGL